MARKSENLGALRRVASAVRGMFAKNRQEPVSTESMSAAETPARSTRPATTPRITRRETDIPLDVIGRTYTPPFTGGKAGFRSDGADHQNDQEFAYGVSDERWNDEDRLTNKSGDPRIGTHRRTYEPGESSIGSRE